ncbi:MAG: hypothetical protein AB8B41_07975, partial [Prochlorococcus sp.]
CCLSTDQKHALINSRVSQVTICGLASREQVPCTNILRRSESTTSTSVLDLTSAVLLRAGSQQLADQP